MTRPVERRSAERCRIEAHLDDLQSEIEAGGRTLTKLRNDASQIDSLMAAHLRHAAVTGDLIYQIKQLTRSLAQQRATLRELRMEMLKLRQATRRG
jgi:predicted RNase H-like nuclease (RuvC/YqgF family)